MASSSSWLQSWTTKTGLSKTLRNYGFTLGNLLKGIRAREKLEPQLLVEDEEGTSSFTAEPLACLGEVENIIKYSFKDKSLLRQAFTHASYQYKCDSYDRLEFVGDSVLGLLITRHQFSMYPNLSPGFLSILRAANVDTEKLARVAVNHNLHKYLRHRNHNLSKQVRGFINDLPQYPLHSYGLVDPPKVLADIVESTIGAVFIDSNSSVDITWEVTKELLEPIITPKVLQSNPVKKLYEVCQKHGLKVRLKDLWQQDGTYEVFVDRRLRGRAQYKAKKEVALNRAANDAYNDIIRSLAEKKSIKKNGWKW